MEPICGANFLLAKEQSSMRKLWRAGKDFRLLCEKHGVGTDPSKYPSFELFTLVELKERVTRAVVRLNVGRLRLNAALVTWAAENDEFRRRGYVVMGDHLLSEPEAAFVNRALGGHRQRLAHMDERLKMKLWNQIREVNERSVDDRRHLHHYEAQAVPLQLQIEMQQRMFKAAGWPWPDELQIQVMLAPVKGNDQMGTMQNAILVVGTESETADL
jgi:hypothetical protein